MKKLFFAVILSIAGIAYVVIQINPSFFARRQDQVSMDVSPISEQIVFCGFDGKYMNLFTLDTKTKIVSRLTSEKALLESPKFSSDASKIAFIRRTETEPASVWTLDLGNKQVKQVTNEKKNYDSAPAFTHDGNLVFLRANLHRPYSFGGMTWNDWDIYTVKSDGTHLKRITNTKYYSIDFVSPSSNSKQIAFDPTTEAPNGDLRDSIFLVDTAKKKEPTPITKDGHDMCPSYSSDGTKIVYLSDRTVPFDYEVWEMNADGSNQHQITHNKSYNWIPRYSADGKRIVFLSDPTRFQRYDLWEINRDGSGLHQIADSTLFDDPMQWKPKK